MNKPLILMVHRVKTDGYSIDQRYNQRNLVIEINHLLNLINTLSNRGYKPGNLEKATYNNGYFHITFDDGFKEHLTVAKILSEELELAVSDCSFAINVGNSLLSDYSGMDLLYNIVKSNSWEKVCDYFDIPSENCDIKTIKQFYIKMGKEKIQNLKNSFKIDIKELENQFLNKREVEELSKLFTITSHGYYHRNLIYHKRNSLVEIRDSKSLLEDLTNQEVDIFCYPEGKNDEDLWEICKNSGYKFGLSINHEPNNNYKIGRYCVNRHIDQIMRYVN